jgi:hypothetical protein
VKLKATSAMPEKILLVEDDYISRCITTMLLKHHFKTEIDEAPVAKTAIELSQKYNCSPDYH